MIASGDLFVHRKGGSLMRVRVLRVGRWTRSAAHRLHARGVPHHHIARCLRLPRPAVDRIARREVWRG